MALCGVRVYVGDGVDGVMVKYGEEQERVKEREGDVRLMSVM